MPTSNYFIIGGAGFIGSHLVKRLFEEEQAPRIVVFDNFSSGRMWHLDEVRGSPNLVIIQGDIKDYNELKRAMEGADIVYHFASNPDISKAATQPDIDFWEGTYLTNNVLEAMRETGVKSLLYASGSGIYGDTGLHEVHEDFAPLLPISTYGASKLACEALINSYCSMFTLQAAVFRFANVVGPHQTHGVGYDFIRRLMENNHELSILGDGTQSKSYIHVEDVLKAMRLIERNHLAGYSYYNVATLDSITVTEIADLVCQVLGLTQVHYLYSGGNRGWKGDVPVIRMNSSKIRALGWENRYSTREAIYLSVSSMYAEAKRKKLYE